MNGWCVDRVVPEATVLELAVAESIVLESGLVREKCFYLLNSSRRTQRSWAVLSKLALPSALPDKTHCQSHALKAHETTTETSVPPASSEAGPEWSPTPARSNMVQIDWADLS